MTRGTPTRSRVKQVCSPVNYIQCSPSCYRVPFRGLISANARLAVNADALVSGPSNLNQKREQCIQMDREVGMGTMRERYGRGGRLLAASVGFVNCC
jgi:hypothetical protein